MARLDILAPFLLDALSRGWAAGAAPARSLAARLARADAAPATVAGYEEALLDCFGYTLAPATAPPLAGITAALDFELDTPPADYLRADPVHLRADPSRLILFDAQTVGLTAEEADLLLAALNDALAGDGLAFLRGAAVDRWYLRAPSAAASGLAVASPRALNGTAIEACLAEIKRAGALNRLLTEAQMVLFETPVNVARVARGQPPLNSLWLWGAGTLPAASAATPSVVFGADDVAAACARHAGVAYRSELSALPAALGDGAHDRILAVAPSSNLDLASFEALIIEPAWAALAHGQLTRIELRTRLLNLSWTPRARWRFWRGADAFVARVRDTLARHAA